MNAALRTSLLLLSFGVTSSCAFANTIQLGSFATAAPILGDANTAMNFAGYSATSTAASTGVGLTYTLNPDTTWAVPSPNSTWVGFSPTAGPVNTSNPPFGYYTFTTSFTASGSYNLSLSLMADDTAEVLLNGTVLVPFGALGTDQHCANGGGDGCLAAEFSSFSNVGLLSGLNANNLTFVVQQAGVGPTGGTGDPTGVDFAATLTAPTVPEPSSLLLFGSGMFLVSALWYRRLDPAHARSRHASSL